MTHQLKTWPEYFNAVDDGSKPFEVREAKDRTFTVGDVLKLNEFQPCRFCDGSGVTEYEGMSNGVKVIFYDDCGCVRTTSPRGYYTGRFLERRVTYVTNFGQREGWVVMGLAPAAA